MRSTSDDPDVVDAGEQLYRRHGPLGIAEEPPEHCPAGHPLQPPNLVVGWDGTGRTYTCWVCCQAGTRPHTLRVVRAETWTGAAGPDW